MAYMTMERIQLRKNEIYAASKWDRVAHKGMNDNITAYCGIVIDHRLNRSDIITGLYPLCNGCFNYVSQTNRH